MRLLILLYTFSLTGCFGNGRVLAPVPPMFLMKKHEQQCLEWKGYIDEQYVEVECFYGDWAAFLVTNCYSPSEGASRATTKEPFAKGNTDQYCN